MPLIPRIPHRKRYTDLNREIEEIEAEIDSRELTYGKPAYGQSSIMRKSNIQRWGMASANTHARFMRPVSKCRGTRADDTTSLRLN